MTVDRTSKGTFKKGVSGCPSGRPKGIVNIGSVMQGAIAAYNKKHGGNAIEEVVEVLVALAKAGDVSAGKLLLEKSTSPLKALVAPVNLGQLPVDAAQKTEKIVQLITDGLLSSDVGKDIINSIVLSLKVSEITQLEERIKDLESSHDA